MSIPLYNKTTYTNDASPPVDDAHLNNNENQLKAISDELYNQALRPSTEKTTLVNADEIAGNDSADSFKQKRTTWTNVKVFLKTYFDTLYMALTGNQTVAGVKTFSSSPVVPTATLSTQATNKGQMDDSKIPIDRTSLIASYTGDGVPEIPDDPVGVTFVRDRNFTSADINIAGPTATQFGWADQSVWDGNGLAVNNGVMQFTRTVSTGGILRIELDGRNKTYRIIVKPAVDCILNFNNDGTNYYIIAKAGVWNLVDVCLDGTGGTASLDIEEWPVGVHYVSAAYIGTGAYLTKVPDRSGNGNVGTIYGATPAQEKFGTALSFNGVSNHIDFNPQTSGNEYTVSLLAKAESSTVSGGLFIFGQIGSSGCSILKQANASTITIFVYRSGGQEELGPFNITLASYTSIVFNYNTSTKVYNLYIDGVLAGSGVTTYTGVMPSANLILGWNTYYTDFFKGTISNVNIFSRALTADEVWKLYLDPTSLNSQKQSVPSKSATGVIAGAPNSLLVADSNGQATFGIVESGSTAKGRYVKWGDGTMQQWGTSEVSSWVVDAQPHPYVCSFIIPFYDLSTIVTVSLRPAIAWLASVGGSVDGINSTSSFNYVISANDRLQNGTVNFIAIGRWKA